MRRPSKQSKRKNRKAVSLLTILESVARVFPCPLGRRWLNRFKNPYNAWKSCPRADWLIWFLDNYCHLPDHFNQIRCMDYLGLPDSVRRDYPELPVEHMHNLTRRALRLYEKRRLRLKNVGK